jgi:hypothetical protein
MRKGKFLSKTERESQQRELIERLPIMLLCVRAKPASVRATCLGR